MYARRRRARFRSVFEFGSCVGGVIDCGVCDGLVEFLRLLVLYLCRNHVGNYTEKKENGEMMVGLRLASILILDETYYTYVFVLL